MAHQRLIVALGLLVAAQPAIASQADPAQGPAIPNAEGKYCLRIEITGTVIEPVRCWTREEWAEQDVDVDKEWAKNGVHPDRG